MTTNKKLLKYFTEQILPILDEIEFNDTEHECEDNGNISVRFEDSQVLYFHTVRWEVVG